MSRFALLCVMLMAVLSGCARKTDELTDVGPIFFPRPPATPRVQYLGSISTPRDLPKKTSTFADFILGPEPVLYIPAKPISAAVYETRLYICDTVLNTVLVYDLINGEARILRGDAGNGKILQPNNITLGDDGRIYIPDKIRNAVLIYGPDEKFVDAWGRPGEVEPVAVALGETEMYVCDMKDHNIEVWDRRTGELKREIGRQGVARGEFYFPSQIAVAPDGNLFVTDTGNFRLQKLTPEGEPIMQIGSHGNALGQFAWPKGMDVDAQGRVYAADARFANVQIFDEEGRLLLFFGGPGRNLGYLDLPAGVRVQPWPDAIPWFRERLAPEIDPEYLVTVVSQKGAEYVNFFAVARNEETGAP